LKFRLEQGSNPWPEATIGGGEILQQQSASSSTSSFRSRQAGKWAIVRNLHGSCVLICTKNGTDSKAISSNSKGDSSPRSSPGRA
ncbi:hypothetical protein ACLOJK_029250, partial [Asimina triloba]